ncbi:MAG: hypothetical protein KAH77_05275 [Thiomargarita sp.]|nr:hypothetical protein [Thiomargarita sp.]
MDTVKTISNHVEKLPIKIQMEVLNFVEYLIFKSELKLTSQISTQSSMITNHDFKNKQRVQVHRSILELRGVGKHLWKDISVKDYINTERDSWNG